MVGRDLQDLLSNDLPSYRKSKHPILYSMLCFGSTWIKIRIRAGHRISARWGGGGHFLGTELFQELGTNIKKKEQNSRKKGTKLKKKRNKTEEKGTQLT